MIYSYAIYLTFCVLGHSCTADKIRIDSFATTAQAQYFISDIGNKPQWKNVSGDLVWEYAYGECYKSRKENYKDLMMWLMVKHGADCEDCVDRKDDTE